MEEGGARGQGNSFLRFFGLETRAKAAEAGLWVAPYLFLLAVAMAGMSYLVQMFFALPLWLHALAIGLAMVHLFFFLARMRQMSLESAEPAEDMPERGEE